MKWNGWLHLILQQTNDESIGYVRIISSIFKVKRNRDEGEECAYDFRERKAVSEWFLWEGGGWYCKSGYWLVQESHRFSSERENEKIEAEAEAKHIDLMKSKLNANCSVKSLRWEDRECERFAVMRRQDADKQTRHQNSNRKIKRGKKLSYHHLISQSQSSQSR